MSREVVVGHRGVKGSDGRYKEHSIVTINGERVDLTGTRQEAAGVGFEGESMKGIRPNWTFVRGALRATFARMGREDSVREAMARDEEYREHGGTLDPL